MILRSLENVFPQLALILMLTCVQHGGNLAAPTVWRPHDLSVEVNASESTDGTSDDLNVSHFLPVVLANQPYQLNEPAVCDDSRVFLLVVVCSAVNHTSRRHVIRETWASVTYQHHIKSDGHVDGVAVVFLTGLSSGVDENVQETVRKESEHSRDIIQGDLLIRIKTYH